MRVRLAVLVALITLFSTIAPVAAEPPTRYIDIVEASWIGAPAPSVTTEQLEQVVRTDTIERWRKVSNGQIVFEFGRRLTQRVTTIMPMTCDSLASLQFMSNVRVATYQRLGITDTKGRYLLILTPRPQPDCVWDGRGSIADDPIQGGTIILKDNVYPEAVAHELGHNLGLGHSNLERCNNGKPDDAWENCSAVEYGSATDLMSNNDRSSPLAAYHQWRLGQIADIDVLHVRTSQTVNLKPVTALNGTRALFIRDKTAAYWVEYRTADPENQIQQGIVIYRTDPPPGSSVVSVIASDKESPTSNEVTADVWMINLGDYTYGGRATKGSPSLVEGKAFSTAFGGTTITVTAASDTGVALSVERANDTTQPAKPVLTSPSTWITPTSELIKSDYLDEGSGIAKFEARITKGNEQSVVEIQPTTTKEWQRTYLNPVTPPVNVHASALPEGNYTLALRGVDAAGNAGPWSDEVPIQVDRGNPIVSNAFQISSAIPNAAVSVQWTGATDAGSGVCEARTVNPEGFAYYAWRTKEASTPSFTFAAATTVETPAQVFDCLGNGVTGDLRITTTYMPAKQFKRTGKWTASGDSLRCTGSCTATLGTSGTSALLMRRGAANLFVDGKLVKRLSTGSNATRIVYNGPITRQIKMTGSNFTLTGLQTASLEWTDAGITSKTPRSTDISLENEIQAALSKIGFSQQDFSDNWTVIPLAGGTGTEQASLDFCVGPYPSESLRQQRRQVFVSGKNNPYIFLSTETVRYRDAAAVRQALKELDDVISACRVSGQATTTAGGTEFYEFHELPPLPSGLRPADDRRVYLTTIGQGSAGNTLLAVYQFKDDLLNALYVVRPGRLSLGTDELNRWLQVAALLAGRM